MPLKSNQDLPTAQSRTVPTLTCAARAPITVRTKWARLKVYDTRADNTEGVAEQFRQTPTRPRRNDTSLHSSSRRHDELGKTRDIPSAAGGGTPKLLEALPVKALSRLQFDWHFRRGRRDPSSDHCHYRSNVCLFWESYASRRVQPSLSRQPLSRRGG
jgi:hypothetical protein